MSLMPTNLAVLRDRLMPAIAEMRRYHDIFMDVFVDHPSDSIRVVAKKDKSSYYVILVTRYELENCDRETLLKAIQQRLELCAEQVKPPDLTVFVDEYEEIMVAQELMEK